MSACNYVLKVHNKKQKLTAQEYGYWSFRWAGDNANEALRSLQAAPFKDMPVISAGCRAPFFLHLQLIALHAACYWVYGATLPHLANTISTEAYTETLARLKAGLDDGIKDLRQSNGKPYSEELVALLMKSFKLFHQSIRDDLVKEPEPDNVVNLNLSRTATVFIAETSRLYLVDPAAIDTVSELVLASFIDDIPPYLLQGMKEIISVHP